MRRLLKTGLRVTQPIAPAMPAPSAAGSAMPFRLQPQTSVTQPQWVSAAGRRRRRDIGIGRSWRVLRRGVVVMALSIAVVAGATGSADAAAYTYYNRGYTGPLLWDGQHYCQGRSAYPRTMTSGESHVSRTSVYANSTQTIYRQAVLQYWTGSTWVQIGQTMRQSRAVAPGWNAVFRPDPAWPVSAGYHYRVVHHYFWYVGNTWLGQVSNGFTLSSYFPYADATAHIDSSGLGYCYI